MLTLTKENFEQEALQSDRPVLVDFWAPWCVYCRRISPVLDRMDGQSDVVIAKINIDEQPELAQHFRVMSIPTLVVVKNGREVQRAVGLHAREQLEEMLRNA